MKRDAARPARLAGGAWVLCGVIAAGPVGVLLAPPAAAAPRAPAPRPAHVLIVSMPGVTWEDVRAGSMPALASLAAAGSVAALSIRTVDNPADPASAFATIGAGNRARALGPGEDTIVPDAGPLPGGGLLVSEWQQVVTDNRSLHYGAVPGAFGQALKTAGIATGVVGNEDEVVAGVRVPMRYAALALADASGHVGTGNVGESMSPGTALASQEDPAALAQATAAALGSARVVLVDLDETRRVGDALSPRTSEAAGLASPVRAAALALDDEALGDVLEDVDLSRDTVLVLGTAGPGAGWPDSLTVAVAAGAGIAPHGWLTSATTRRSGLVTLPDVAPGILHLLGVAVPASMTGQPIRSVPGQRDRLGALRDLDTASNAYAGRIVAFLLAVSVAGVTVFGAGWALLRRGVIPGGRPSALVSTLGLAVGAAPAAAVAQAAIGGDRWRAPPSFALLVAVDALVVGVALAGPWRRRGPGPASFVAAVSVGAIAADLLTGSHAQLAGLLGYSPIEAGRFYGLSPLSFAVLATDACVFGAVLAGAAGPPGRRRTAVALAVGAAAIVVAGAPMLGAKFGAILTLVPAFGLLVLLLAARRVSVVKVAALAIAAGVVALGAGVLDALRPAQDRTHIGRFVIALFGGGPGGVKDVLARKVAANLGIYARAPAAYLIPLALAFCAIVLWRPPGWLAARIDGVPGLRAGLVAALAANVVALFVNDSGVGIPAMGLAIGVPLVVAMLLAVEPQPAGDGAARLPVVAPGDGDAPTAESGVGRGSVAPGPVP